MAKKTPEVRLISFGIYTEWNAQSKALPKLLKRTLDVPCELDVEFGYIVNIKHAKNKELHYCIVHPNVCDEKQKVLPPFKGVEYIRQNDWRFFIGDTVWAPIQDKRGNWRITLTLDEKVVADEVFVLS